MSLTLLLLPLLPLLTADAEYPAGLQAPRQDPCISNLPGAVVVHGPGPSETDVPLNTSLWLSVLDGDASGLEVTLLDPSAAPVTTHIEPLLQSPRFEAAVRVVVDQPLLPRTRYALTWRNTLNGRMGGHSFTTGDARDDTAPAAPAIDRVEGGSLHHDCYASYGLTVHVRSSTESADLLHLVEINGRMAGVARGETVLAIHGQADASVTGAVVAVDLAGNRSTPPATIQGVTPTAGTIDLSDDVSEGCSNMRASVRGTPSSSTLALMIVLLLVWNRRVR